MASGAISVGSKKRTTAPMCITLAHFSNGPLLVVAGMQCVRDTVRPEVSQRTRGDARVASETLAFFRDPGHTRRQLGVELGPDGVGHPREPDHLNVRLTARRERTAVTRIS